jgi:hypothetical protein
MYKKHIAFLNSYLGKAYKQSDVKSQERRKKKKHVEKPSQNYIASQNWARR